MTTASISSVEAFLISTMQTLLAGKVKGVQTLPGDWDDQMLKTFARSVPGIFLSFTGGERVDTGGRNQARIDGRWAVYICTGHPTEEARRLGDALVPGAYTLLGLLAPVLHGLLVPDVGSVNLVSVQNLYTGSIERQALTVYALVLSLPLTFELVPPDAVLAPFMTFDAKYDIPPLTPDAYPAWLAGDTSTSRPDAEDDVQLPQT